MDTQRPWLNHYPAEIPTNMKYDQKPLYAYLIDNAQTVREEKALHFQGKEMTYGEVWREVKQLAAFLQQQGLNKGDRVASMLPNCPQAVITYYAVLLAGGVVVQINPLFTERELAYQVEDAEAPFIICLDILFPRVSKVREDTGLKQVIVTRIADYLPFPKNIIYPFIQKKQYDLVVKVEETADTHTWRSILKREPLSYEQVDINPLEDLALIQYTGGTTGKPKGVMLTHHNLTSNVQMCAQWMYRLHKGKEVILGVLPFFHVYGMTTVMNLSIMFQAKMILLPKFDAKEVLQTIEKLKPTLFPGAPTIYIGLLNHPDLSKYDLSSVKACISGSAALPVEIQEQFEKVTKGRLVEGYGLTESSPVTHANFIWDKRVNGSIGVPWPDTDAKIVKQGTIEEIAIGEIGELAVKGPQIMKGYWNNEAATKKVLQDGWLLTGDMGYMDEAGYFYIVDRKTDMIIASGYNIYPREVEEVLFEHPDIQEAAVIGVPDEYRGETVRAVIVPKQSKTLDVEELTAFCQQRLATYKVPKQFVFQTSLPKSIIGKVLKRELVEAAQQDLTRKEESV